jgi:hypothetical protein
MSVIRQYWRDMPKSLLIPATGTVVVCFGMMAWIGWLLVETSH